MRTLFVAIFITLFLSASMYTFHYLKKDTIKVGLLYSKTGVMSYEESAIAKIVNYAVDEINHEGGLLNKKIEIIEYDGASQPEEFKKGAKYIIDHGADVIFGCWTSSSRKAVKDVVEKHEKILFYPIQYEGVEESKNIIYLGPTPNQQINPIITFIKKNFGKSIYLVGSDYIYPRMTNFYINSLSKYVDLHIVGEEYINLDSNDYTNIIDDINQSYPDVIINTINGKGNVEFFNALHKANLTSKKLAVFSLSIDENSLHKMSIKLPQDALYGHYAVSNYFNSIASKENKEFLTKLHKSLGKDFILSDGAYSSYLAVQIWKNNVKIADSFEVAKILPHLKKYSLNTLSGILYINNNNHTNKTMKIAQINENNKFEVIWKSDVIITPKPFPSFERKEYWINQEESLYKSWGNQWQANEEGRK